MKTPDEQFSYIKSFHEAYLKYSDDTLRREIECLTVMFPYIFLPPEEGDLFVGRLYYPEIGLSPEPLGGRGVCFNYDVHAFERLKSQLAPQDRLELERIQCFWEKENTRYKIRQAFPEDISRALPYDDVYYKESNVAFPLYRTVGIYLDYEKLLTLGIPGLKEVIWKRKMQARVDCDQKAEALMDAMCNALELLVSLCDHYIRILKQLIVRSSRESQKQFSRIIVTLESIKARKPCHLHEAMQLSFLFALVSGALNYGRMDVYLGSFYKQDMSAKVLTRNEALSYFQSLWTLIAARKTIFHGRVIVGGLGRPDEETADPVAFLAIEASRTVKEVEPQLTFRFYEGQNPELMEKALDCIGEGRTYPMLYNDDVNVPAVMDAFQVSFEEAVDYLPLGCGEYVLNHRSFGSPNGIINVLKALEVTMHNGVDPLTGRPMGIKTGRFEDFESFDDFYGAYKEQLAWYIEKLARQEVIEYEVVSKQAPFLFMSMLYDNCIERGKAIFDGGIQYLGGTLETYGNVNASNSLAAIRKVVFEDNSVSRSDLLDALDRNFEGREDIRRLLLDAPKYGNDDPYADRVAADLHECLCRMVQRQSEKVPLHSYLVVIINNEANTLVGEFTAASADGRRAREYLANANAPAGGTDKNGITALLNSTVKLRPNVHAGAVQNLKLSKHLFNENRSLASSLLRGYFKSGGAQLMITILDKEDLEKALIYPDQYRNLMVRVGGFSARFVELNPHVQREIMSRTLY